LIDNGLSRSDQRLLIISLRDAFLHQSTIKGERGEERKLGSAPLEEDLPDGKP
jgi:hypothetical protein